VVQEALLRVHRALEDGERLESPRAFVATVTTRLAIDELRSARAVRRRVAARADPERHPEMAESLSPEQRAVLLLHDVFYYGYDEIAGIVRKRKANVRQLATRPRRQIEQRRPRFQTLREQRDELARRFFAAVQEGDIAGPEALLAHDVVLTGDGGAEEVPALARILRGRDRVARTLISWITLARPRTRCGAAADRGESRVRCAVDGRRGPAGHGLVARHRRWPDPRDQLGHQPREAHRPRPSRRPRLAAQAAVIDPRASAAAAPARRQESHLNGMVRESERRGPDHRGRAHIRQGDQLPELSRIVTTASGAIPVARPVSARKAGDRPSSRRRTTGLRAKHSRRQPFGRAAERAIATRRVGSRSHGSFSDRLCRRSWRSGVGATDGHGLPRVPGGSEAPEACACCDRPGGAVVNGADDLAVVDPRAGGCLVIARSACWI